MTLLLFVRRALGAVAIAAGVATAGAASAAPVLSEVLYDAAGADDGRVFVELAGDPGEVLAG